ncbi:DNA repair protein RecN [Acidipropionibacterium jensenii]|uniref:DNA repair protein RecN n=1 Tax=Acidipropionibacterium jensenii TaxID=1749 RepID=UPI000BC2FB78|nr:DNA repair protein RecN [Acidipropionibacterium jensenii]AZZ42361.1 DNA repair protein RecN [Acidipropionibacterium jensenii]
MIGHFLIRDLGVIDEAEVEFSPGLTAVTGETGAGKTMVVSGLGLLLGQRADPGLVRRGARRAVVEATLGVDPPIARTVAELGGETEDGEVICSRQVLASHRSRSSVGGAQVTAGQLGRLTASTLTIHGQSDQIRLTSPDHQLDVLDRAAGSRMTDLLEAHRDLWRRHREVAEHLTRLSTGEHDRSLQIEVLRRRIAEVDAVDPQPGEDRELIEEMRRLQRGQDTRAALARADRSLNGTETESGMDPGAVSLLDQARRELDSLADLDESCATLARTARGLGYDLAELASEVASQVDRASADPARIEQVNGRLAAIQALVRTRATTLERLLSETTADRRELAQLDGGGADLSALEEQLAQLTGRLETSAATISALRSTTAARLAHDVAPEFAALAMPRASLEFRLSDAPMGPRGTDQVTIMLAANPGAAPAPLARAASGGELSRVRLALEVVLAATETAQTFVFDEVDAGVGGAVGIEIGRRLAQLADRHQVIVVTHLPQVAAFADRQLVVTKASDGRITRSGVHQVSGPDRLSELARMMTGMADSELAVEHARELIGLAAQQRGDDSD